MRVKVLGVLRRHPARDRARHRAHRVRAVGQKQVRLLRGNAPDAVVLRARPVAELQHVAKNRDALSARFDACKHPERRFGRLRARVVAVLNDRHAVFLVDLLAHAGILEDGELILHRLWLDLQQKPDRRRSQRVIDHVPPQRRDEELKLMAKAAHVEAHAVFKLLDTAGDHIAVGIVNAVVIFFVVPKAAHVPQKRLVAVENADGIFKARAQNIEFLLQNALAAAEILDVRRADVRDDRVVRLGDRAQIRNLARVVRTKLGDEQLRILRRIQNGHGEANIVIVVPCALEELKVSSQNARNHFLRRCLADAAGDADDLEGKHLAVVPRDLAIGPQRVFDHDARKLPAFLAHERRNGALSLGGGDIIVSVDPLAAKRQE